jgi:hypothetical protein
MRSNLCKNNNFKLNEMSMMQMQKLLEQLKLSYQLELAENQEYQAR